MSRRQRYARTKMNIVDFTWLSRNCPLSGRLRQLPSKGRFPVHRMRPTDISRPTIAYHVLGMPMFLARSHVALSA